MQATETPESREITGNPPTVTLRYKVTGEIDEAVVFVGMMSVVPETWRHGKQTLYRQDIRVRPRGGGVHAVEVPYGTRDQRIRQYRFSFDTTGERQRIYVGRETRRYSAAGENNADTPDFKNAINVDDDDRVQGADVPVPGLKLTYRIRWEHGYVDEILAQFLARMTGRTNSKKWHGLDPGEALFLGATGDSGTEAETELAYHVLASENAVLDFGDIPLVTKKGHEIVWFKYGNDADAKAVVRRPKYVYCVRTQQTMDFRRVLGF